MRSYLLILFVGLAPLSGSAQKFTTNEELQVDKFFIEATSHRILGDFEKARVLYEQVLEKDPLHDAAAYELARVYDALDMSEEALSVIKKAITLDPENQWYRVMHADILEKRENYSVAAEVYVELIQNFPDQQYYYEHLIGLYKRMGQIRKALVILEQYEAKAGVIEDLIRDQFDLYNQIGEQQKALAALKRLIRTYPYEVDYLHMIATYCVQLGDYEQASEYYDQILDLNPGDAKAKLALARGYKEKGRDTDYLESIKDLMGNPSIQVDAKIQELLPFTELLMIAPDSALANTLLSLADMLVSTHPNEAKCHALRADILSLMNRQTEARQEYERTLLLDNSVFTVWEQLLYIQAAQQDYDALIKSAERALDVFPNQASIYYLSGVGHLRKRNYSDAISMLDQALIMTAQQPELRLKVLLLLGEVHFESGEHAKSFQAFEKAIAQAPHSFPAHLQYSLALVGQSKDLKKAMSLAEKAARINVESPQAPHVQALIAFKMNEFAKAREYAEISSGKGYQDHSGHMELYGDILFSLGKVEEAVAAWQRSQELGNKDPLLSRKIEERKIVH